MFGIALSIAQASCNSVSVVMKSSTVMADFSHGIVIETDSSILKSLNVVVESSNVVSTNGLSTSEQASGCSVFASTSAIINQMNINISNSVISANAENAIGVEMDVQSISHSNISVTSDIESLQGSAVGIGAGGTSNKVASLTESIIEFDGTLKSQSTDADTYGVYVIADGTKPFSIGSTLIHCDVNGTVTSASVSGIGMIISSGGESGILNDVQMVCEGSLTCTQHPCKSRGVMVSGAEGDPMSDIEMRNVEIVSLANVSGYSAAQVYFENVKGYWSEVSVYGSGVVIGGRETMVDTSKSVCGILCNNCCLSTIEKCTFVLDGTVIGEGLVDIFIFQNIILAFS